jgi:hypothetical protein
MTRNSQFSNNSNLIQTNLNPTSFQLQNYITQRPENGGHLHGPQLLSADDQLLMHKSSQVSPKQLGIRVVRSGCEQLGPVSFCTRNGTYLQFWVGLNVDAWGLCVCLEESDDVECE